MAGFMSGVAGMIQQTTQASQTQGGSSSEGAAILDGRLWLKRFMRLHPPVFKGEPDPKAAEEWVREVSMLFEAMEA